MTELELIESLQHLVTKWREDYYALETRLKEVAAERDALKNELRVLRSSQSGMRYFNPLDQQYHPYITES